MHPMRRNPLPTLLFYSVPIISLAPVGLLFQRPPKLSLTKQKSAKRFRKIGATDSSQFDAPNAKKSSAKQFSKKHTFEELHSKCSNISSLCWFFFFREVQNYMCIFWIFRYEQISSTHSEDIFCHCWFDRALFFLTILLEFRPEFLRLPPFATVSKGNFCTINW